MLSLLTRCQESISDIPEANDIEPEPVEAVQFAEPENVEGTFIKESPTSEPVLEPSNGVKEVLMEAESVVTTPLTLAVQEHLMEPVVIQGASAVDPGVDVAPDVVAVVTAPVEGSEPSAEEPNQGGLVSAVPGPAVEPVAAKEPASNPLELGVPTPEFSLGVVPSIEFESAREPQESGTDQPPIPSDENPSTGEAELKDASPAISGFVEAAHDALTSDVPQEQTSQTERSWTPSYSVSSQGRSLDTSSTADEGVVEPTPAPEPHVEEPAVEPVPTSETVTSVEVRTLDLPLPSWKTDRLSP